MISDDILKRIADPKSPSLTWGAVAQEMAQELLQRREAERKIDMLSDSIWIAGAKFGWNCGVAGDNDALQASIEGRIRERVKDKKECT